MKNLFRALVAALLVISVLFIMTGCVSKSKLVGTWTSEYTYEGSKFFSTIVLDEGGTYGSAIVKDGKVHKVTGGTWEVKGSNLVLHDDEENTVTEYKISLNGKKLTNNGHDYKMKDS